MLEIEYIIFNKKFIIIPRCFILCFLNISNLFSFCLTASLPHYNSSSTRDISHFQPWCSTEVDDNGHHKGGRGKWGNCGPGCPIPPDDRESTVVVPDTKGRTNVPLDKQCSTDN